MEAKEFHKTCNDLGGAIDLCVAHKGKLIQLIDRAKSRKAVGKIIDNTLGRAPMGFVGAAAIKKILHIK